MFYSEEVLAQGGGGTGRCFSFSLPRSSGGGNGTVYPAASGFYDMVSSGL